MEPIHISGGRRSGYKSQQRDNYEDHQRCRSTMPIYDAQLRDPSTRQQRSNAEAFQRHTVTLPQPISGENDFGANRFFARARNLHFRTQGCQRGQRRNRSPRMQLKAGQAGLHSALTCLYQAIERMFGQSTLSKRTFLSFLFDAFNKIAPN